jgi:hypothetical protein
MDRIDPAQKKRTESMNQTSKERPVRYFIKRNPYTPRADWKLKKADTDIRVHVLLSSGYIEVSQEFYAQMAKEIKQARRDRHGQTKHN